MKRFMRGEPGNGESVRVTETGDAIATAGAIANSGYINQLILPPRPLPSWPHQVGVVPPRAASYQQRSAVEELRALDGMPCTVLSGTGGVGKTQIAAVYARDAFRQGDIDLLLWITADSRTALVSGYARAAGELFARDFADPEVAAAEFLAWLQPKPGHSGRRWLVVLDDLQDPADLSGLWPPESAHGRTLITTRRRDAALYGDGRQPVEVGVFSTDEARGYLRASLVRHRREESEEQLDALAVELGLLPLALSQAVAYLVDVDVPVSEYRALLADRARSLGEVLPDLSGLPDQQRHTVAAAWELSIERADALPPLGLARPMLQLASVLDPNGIPTAVLTGATVVARLGFARHEAGATGRPVDAHDARAALRVLHRMSLLDHVAVDGANEIELVRVHKLIQRACLDQCDSQERYDAAYFAALALMECWPEHGKDMLLALLLRASVTAVHESAVEILWATDAYNVLLLAGNSLATSGQMRAATSYFLELYEEACAFLGSDNPVSLSILGRAAQWQRHAGDPVGAARTLDFLLPRVQEMFGPESAEVAALRFNRARYIGDSGNLSDAIAEIELILASGPEPQAYSRGDCVARMVLARFKTETGDFDSALELLQGVLAVQIQSIGADHRDTFTTRDSIGHLLGEMGRTEEAVGEFRSLLVDRGRVLGADHPDTRTAKSGLAQWLARSGCLDESIALLESELSDLERLGVAMDEADVLALRHNLACAVAQSGSISRAITVLRAVLVDRLRVLGPEHPDTLRTRKVLALLRGQDGDPAGAIVEMDELLMDQLRILGPTHPDLLMTRNNRAMCLAETGDVAGGLGELALVLSEANSLLPPEHHVVVTVRENEVNLRARARGGNVVFGITAT